MIKYKLRGGITIWLDADDGNESAMIQFEGDEGTIEIVRDRLLRSYGAFGHLMSESTTPIDLDAALRGENFRLFKPQCIEGAELVERYDPGIPPGAVT